MADAVASIAAEAGAMALDRTVIADRDIAAGIAAIVDGATCAPLSTRLGGS